MAARGSQLARLPIRGSERANYGPRTRTLTQPIRIANHGPRFGAPDAQITTARDPRMEGSPYCCSWRIGSDMRLRGELSRSEFNRFLGPGYMATSRIYSPGRVRWRASRIISRGETNGGDLNGVGPLTHRDKNYRPERRFRTKARVYHISHILTASWQFRIIAGAPRSSREP